jgi:hypothetical protein
MSRFEGNLILEVLRDDAKGLYEVRPPPPYFISDKFKVMLRLEVGLITDLCSTPLFTRSIIGEQDRYAGAFHDDLYKRKTFTRKQSDQLLFEMMVAEDTPRYQCHIYYFFVRLVGWWFWHGYNRKIKKIFKKI